MFEILNIINIIHSSKEFWKNIGLRSRCIVSLPGLHDAPIFYFGFMKDIPGYEGLYAVAKDGRVWSHPKKTGPNGKGGFLKSCFHRRDGYMLVGLWVNGKVKTEKVHRLVAKTYIPNPDNKGDVNHKNGIKTDNNLENLEWATRGENIRHAIAILGKIHKGANGKPIQQLDKEGNLIAVFKTTQIASKTLNIHPVAISICLTGKSKTSGGFIWKYL